MKNGDDSQADSFVEAAREKLAKFQQQVESDKQQQAMAEALAAKLNG